MGTNYYVHTPARVEAVHIGKHSATSPPWTLQVTEEPWSTPEELRLTLAAWMTEDPRTWMVDEYGVEVDPIEIADRIARQGWRAWDRGDFC